MKGINVCVWGGAFQSPEDMFRTAEMIPEVFARKLALEEQLVVVVDTNGERPAGD